MSTLTLPSRRAVGVVGAARMGLALAHQLALNGHDVYLFTTMDERAVELRDTRRVESVLPELDAMHPSVRVTTDASELAAHTTLIFVTISDYLLTKVLDLLGEHLNGAHMIVHATHSLYGEGLRRASEIVAEATCVKQIGVLAGPIHMSELLDQKPNVALVGSEFPEVIARARAALEAGHFHIYGSSDIRGVEYAAALHQIVALAIGLADGLDLGSATHAAFVAAGLNEIARVGVERGAAKDSFYGLVGVGRIVDALQRGESNYSLGLALARAQDRSAVLEAAAVEAKAPEVVELLLAWSASSGIPLPFTEALGRILHGTTAPEPELRSLMNRAELFSQV